MGTLWNKGVSATQAVEDFTVGNDRVLDMRLAKYDVIGSKAHIRMLAQIGLLEEEEEKVLQNGLDQILKEIEEGNFRLDDDIEDIHSQVELNLTGKLGEIGKKIHSGRSRNDQVLVDIKLFLREELEKLRDSVVSLFDTLQNLSEKYKDVLLPGYTHTQIAMPSSFGLWLGAYAESLTDDMQMLRGAYRIVNQNPLGSAAGYGSSFPLDRELTTRILKFETLNYNSIAAQMNRGKSERAVASAMGCLAFTLNKLASDCILYMCPNFGFISFPDELTTGSSIMPHKKNPDVWEIIRGSCNRIESTQNEIALLTTNLIHGYHRDYQLLKDILFPALELMHKSVAMAGYMLENMRVNRHILEDSKYEYLFTVEEVNRRVLKGVPFREAYKSVGEEVNGKKFGFLAVSRVIPDVSWKVENAVPGIFSCYDETRLLELVREAKEQCDFVTVFPHWGTEYSEQPNEVQKQIAEKCMEAGADLIVGSHTHCLQGIEYFDGKPVFYSLGNFIFGQSIERSAAVRVTVKQDGSTEIALIPVRAAVGQTSELAGEEAAAVYSYMESISVNAAVDENGIVTERR